MERPDAHRHETFFASLHPFGDLFEIDQPLWRAITKIKSFVLDKAEHDGSSYISPQSFVHPSALISDSFIAEEARVYEFTSIRESIIGPGVVVGHCTEIVRSIILSECSLPRFNYIGSSILGKRVRLGGCASIASRRFDDGEVIIRDRSSVEETEREKFGAIVGDDCLIGFAVHCNPGTLIGKRTIIMPHAEVSGVVPSDCTFSIHQATVISPIRDLSSLGLGIIARTKDHGEL